MKYPGRVIKLGEQEPEVVRALKTQLNAELGFQAGSDNFLDPENTDFDANTKQAVKLFQMRRVDPQGRPLKVDGEVGPITWEALFGGTTVPSADQAGGDFLATVLQVAGAEEQKKVREEPRNSNSGPQVDEYLRRAGVEPGLAWCCAFVYWCFDEAAKAMHRSNPMFKTAGCLAHWNGAPSKGAKRIQRFQAVADPGLIQPGMVFIMDTGGGTGHTGLVESIQGGFINTIEGNTDASLTREGGGVYRLTRKIADINKGFIDYAGL
ncbi:MAG: peptidoglycan-binding protein [Leptothrix sp. (in: b-proteobacteria)]